LKQFVILAVVMFIGQGVVAYFLVADRIMPKYLEPDETEVTQEIKKSERIAIPVTAPVLYEVDDMVVNPQSGQVLRYLSIKVVLELNSPETLVLLGDPVVEAEVVDLIRKILNNINYNEINEADERDPLRQRLMTEINASGLLKTGSVTAVYFTQFILQ
jgi:flagellar basal body-associated protein FliL